LGFHSTQLTQLTMALNLQNILKGSFWITLINFLGRSLPPKQGHWLADRVAKILASRRELAMVQAVRANQWVVRGESLDKAAMDQAVLETLKNSALSFYNLYHYLEQPEVVRNQIIMDSVTELLMQRKKFESRGLVVAGLHLSNFDLILQWMCTHGFDPMVLTIPDPHGAHQKEYERRKAAGMNLVPASISAFRQALKHLQQGGIVLTGIDRPIPDANDHPMFFGRPSALPLHYIYLASKAKAPVVVMAVNLSSERKYQILTSELIEMDDHDGDENGDILNAEKVLRIAEELIRKSPGQWGMSLPVWPETLELVPN